MNREQVIRMATEAGLLETGYIHGNTVIAELERFAALVAAAEREACEKVCDDAAMGFGDETEWAQGYVQGINDVADGIRARGAK